MEENNALTYKTFDIEAYKAEAHVMEEFRTNCFGESMEGIWGSLRSMYLPTTVEDGLPSRYTFTSDASAATTLAIPDTLYASDNSEILSFKEPLVAIKIHTALSLLTSRTPDVKWDSDNTTFEENVPIVNALRTYDWQDAQTRQQYTMLWFYNIMYGTTFWRRYHEKIDREVNLPKSLNLATNAVEYEAVTINEIDQTCGEALSPLQVWIDPGSRPLAPRSQRKVMWEKVYTYEQFILAHKGLKDEKWLRENIHGTSVENYPGTDLVKCRYYENMDLDLFYVVANDEEVTKMHMPQNHKQLSVIMAIWMPRGDFNPYGLGPIEMMAEDKKALDEVKSMTFTQLKFSIYKAIFYTGTLKSDGGQGGDVKIRPDMAYKVSEKPFFMEMPGPGQESWTAQTNLRERADDASGINRPLGGEIVKTTAFQTDLAKDAALARLSVPISNVVLLLVKDAELTFELQKQFYTLPRVKEIVDPKEVVQAQEELDKLRTEGKTPNFDIWVDMDSVDEDGMIVPHVFKGTYRDLQLNVGKQNGQYMPSQTKSSVTLTPDLMNWKGKIHIVADSILSITPTLEKTRKLEMYNLLIPMFSQKPEFVAKPAAAIVKLYGDDIDDVLPEHFIAYLKQLENPMIENPPLPGAAPLAAEQPPGTPAPEGTNPDTGAMNFEQMGAPVVATNMGGQKDMISAASERLNA